MTARMARRRSLDPKVRRLLEDALRLDYGEITSEWAGKAKRLLGLPLEDWERQAILDGPRRRRQDKERAKERAKDKSSKVITPEWFATSGAFFGIERKLDSERLSGLLAWVPESKAVKE